MLLDPATFGPATRIAHHHVAPNARHVLVELAVGGDDWKVGRVVRVADGVLLPDSIPGIVFQSPLWIPNSKGILQVQYIHPASSERVMLQPPRLVDVELGTGQRTTVLETTSEFPSADYVETQQWYAGKDGTRIPIWLVHRKGIALDGSHPTLLFGYAGSGTVMLPDYAPELLAWLELGGVFAMPNLRGGGEFGRNWYEAAILGKKQTTFDDMIAAAEHLIARGYTPPSRLAIRGRSNGGRMVAAVMAERPDLFAAVVAEVPQTDNVRFDHARHRAQFGSPSDPAQFGFLLATSPLHRVTAGRCYPATLVTTSLNDPRAPAWHAMKFTAALQKPASATRARYVG